MEQQVDSNDLIKAEVSTMACIADNQSSIKDNAAAPTTTTSQGATDEKGIPQVPPPPPPSVPGSALLLGVLRDVKSADDGEDDNYD